MKPNYRCCISCRRIAPKESLLRIVRVYPDRQIQLDRGMGRSAYICPQETCVSQAFNKKRLARSLRTKIPPNITHNLQQRLLARVAAKKSN